MWAANRTGCTVAMIGGRLAAGRRWRRGVVAERIDEERREEHYPLYIDPPSGHPSLNTIAPGVCG